MQVAVIGAGAWGTTMAARLATRTDTVLWARDRDRARLLATGRVNQAHLPGVAIPAALRVTADPEEAVAEAEALLVAVPSHGLRATLGGLAPWVRPGTPVVSLAKGLEEGTDRRMTEVVADVLPGSPAGALTGPNLAPEIAAGQPAAAVLAMADGALARRLQAVVGSTRFRVYTNGDVVGCELGGALKNVVAIAAGMVAGMGLGHNALAAVVTRGLAELTRLGVALGGEAPTFAGLAGLGDLVATCTSPGSRNRSVGEALGRGLSPPAAQAAVAGVAEGVRTSAVVVRLAARLGVEVPISAQVAAVCHDGRPVGEAAEALLGRDAGAEVPGPVGTDPAAAGSPDGPPSRAGRA